MALIAPSLLSADFLNLGKDCEMLNKSRADWFHLDVMDGHFVPNISFGPMIVDFIRKTTGKYCDVHLMIKEPEKYTVAFRKAGADGLTVHIETCTDLHQNLHQIKDLGMKPGIAINPGTPVELLEPFLEKADVVCMMSVHPGFGGQPFIEETYERIKTLRAMIDKTGLKTLIEIDGGVTLDNAADIIKAGADVLVAGNTVFRSPDPIKTIEKLKSL
jgi:ribulose-phosphate 3-epimerase